MTERDIPAERHMGLVHAICGRFSGKGIEYEELFSAGCLGLTKALNNFDETRGIQFSTYAFPVIAGEIKRLFRDGGAVKVSRSIKELSLKIAKLGSELTEKNGTEPSVSQLAEILGVSVEKITEAVGSSLVPLSVYAGDGGEGALAGTSVPDIQEEITERLSLRQAVNELDDRDRRLIILRYYQNKTQTETAGILNISQVQVSRLEKKILARLRAQMCC